MGFSFSPAQYGGWCAPLLTHEHLCELVGGRPDASVYPQLRDMEDALLFEDATIQDTEMAACCRSGLWLLHDYLDESHQISQSIETATGSYWHGIMHRREPDFSNAAYWFRRVGTHPVFADLVTTARELAQDTRVTDVADSDFLRQQQAWDPFRFIDLCSAAVDGRPSSGSLCRRIAHAEWQLLFDYCYRHSRCERTGSAPDR